MAVMTPAEARLRNMTYKCPLRVDITHKKYTVHPNGDESLDEQTTYKKVFSCFLFL